MQVGERSWAGIRGVVVSKKHFMYLFKQARQGLHSPAALHKRSAKLWTTSARSTTLSADSRPIHPGSIVRGRDARATRATSRAQAEGSDVTVQKASEH